MYPLNCDFEFYKLFKSVVEEKGNMTKKLNARILIVSKNIVRNNYKFKFINNGNATPPNFMLTYRIN